jgi:hypothetical protein
MMMAKFQYTGLVQKCPLNITLFRIALHVMEITFILRQDHWMILYKVNNLLYIIKFFNRYI